MPKVLMVSFFFPPTSGMPSQRIGGFAKYLPEYGWTPTVLTPDKMVFPPPSLHMELTTEIIRTKWWNPWDFLRPKALSSTGVTAAVTEKPWGRIGLKGLDFIKNFLPWSVSRIPDRALGWYRFALKKGIQIIEQENIDILFSSHGPPTSHFIAASLYKRFRIPWVADFRDLWSLHYGEKRIRPIHLLEQKIEKYTISGARRLVTVSEPLAEILREFHSKPVDVIHNSFDEQDYKASVYPSNEKFIITYTGNIYLGKRDPEPLLIAISRLKQQGVVSKDNFELRFFGTLFGGLNLLIKKYKLNDVIKICGFIPYKESVFMQQSSHVLLVLGWTDITEKGVYTGKLFEYLGANRPILYLGPYGRDMDELIRKCGGIMLWKVEDVKAQLVKWLNEFRDKGIAYSPDKEFVTRHSRKYLTGQLAEVFNEVVAT